MDARDRAYFLRRIIEEQDAAASAACAAARERHEELAVLYRKSCAVSGGAERSDEKAPMGVDFAA